MLFRSPVYHGTPYTWLHPEVRRLSQARVPAEQRARVLVIMGGADPKNRTQEAIEWLNRLGVREIDVVVGPANKFGQEIRQAMENIGSQARCLENISEARSALARARFAICAFGISAYECYSLGTPVLLATHEKSDRRDAEAFLNRMPHAGVFWDPSANFIPEFRNFPDPSLGNQLGHLAENLGKILRSI